MKKDCLAGILVVFLMISVDLSCCKVSGSHSCHTILDSFQDSCQKFTTHLVKYAVPVTYCQQAIKDYLTFEESYKNLTTAVDSQNVTCRDVYLNVDRLGVVETMYNQLHRMWVVGFCDDCYSNVSSAILSNTTRDFLFYWQSINECINGNSDPCLMCVGHYQKLNDFYDAIKREKDDQVCFDLQDAMNRTRILWSVKLNCCRDRNSSMLSFYIISAVVGVLPVLFYLVIFLWTRHQDRFDLLSDEQNTTASDQAESASVQNVSHGHEENQPGPSGMNSSAPVELPGGSGDVKKRQILDESDDDSILDSRKK
uniref:Putative conserved secreted protein n=1 Tax=Phlebotomus kandelakii TaxID=1109342 RepID=A0A6B2EC58_9DIPT